MICFIIGNLLARFAVGRDTGRLDYTPAGGQLGRAFMGHALAARSFERFERFEGFQRFERC
jgi:hypothetical protein